MRDKIRRAISVLVLMVFLLLIFGGSIGYLTYYFLPKIFDLNRADSIKYALYAVLAITPVVFFISLDLNNEEERKMGQKELKARVKEYFQQHDQS